MKVLEHLKREDPENKYAIIKIQDYFMFRKHLCIIFDLLSINMYELIQMYDFEGLPMSFIRNYAKQMLEALKFMKNENVIHCDLKPENILLHDKEAEDGGKITIIDLGSSCFYNERLYTYI